MSENESTVEQQLIIQALGELQFANIMKAAQMEKLVREIEKLKKEGNR